MSMYLVPSIFKSLGWEWKSPYFVYKGGKARLGWNPETGTFIIGYGELPNPIYTFGELLKILEICGYEEELKKARKLMANK